MRKQFTTDSELKDLVGTQYVFVEVMPAGETFDYFKKTYKVEIDRKNLPRNFIISAKGELVKDFSMHEAGGLVAVLKDGIEKTGGLKGAAGAAARLKTALDTVKTNRELLEAEEGDALQPLLALVALDRVHGKQMPEVRKEIKKIVGKFEKDADQKAVLTQARMIDSASQLAEAKKTKRAIEMYQDVVAKYPDTSGAKLAQERITQLEAPPAEAPAAAADPAKDEPAKDDAPKKKKAKKPAAEAETADTEE